MNKTTTIQSCCSNLFISLLMMLIVGLGASSAYAADLELDGNIRNDGITDWEDIFDVSGNNVPKLLPRYLRDFRKQSLSGILYLVSRVLIFLHLQTVVRIH